MEGGSYWTKWRGGIGRRSERNLWKRNHNQCQAFESGSVAKWRKKKKNVESEQEEWKWEWEAEKE